MPKYLFTATYTASGTQGLLKEGGSKRRAAIEQLISNSGGHLEGMYYALGEDDVYLIVDLPDQATASAISLTVNATGAVRLKTTPLISMEELDQATKKKVKYRMPGK
jgi:uncharacterized protein with GYD domain